jgi:hypothetical protein
MIAGISQASACKNLVTFIGQGEQRLTTQTERPARRKVKSQNEGGVNRRVGSIQCPVRRRAI